MTTAGGADPSLAARVLGRCLLSLAVAAACACRAEKRAFVNAPVVLICVDTLRADHLPVYGYKGVETPALDALARDSIVFENAISQVPLTLPSHASLFTGLLPFANGVRDNVGYRLEKQRATLAGLLRARGYATGAAVSAFVLDHSTGISSGFDFYEDRLEARGSGQAIGEVQRPGAESEKLLENWIVALPPGKPFFAFLHLYEPHAPYAPPEPFAARYATAPYDGEIAAADSIVGVFLAFLKTKGLYEKSHVVFLSDHGEGLNEHGEDEHGIFLYREAIRVPLFIKLPGRPDPRREPRPAALVDVLPTIVRSVGGEAPPGLAGMPLWSAEAGSGGGRNIYSETLYPRLHFGWSDLASLTDGRFHYVHAPRAELYDWTSDPAEKKDLAAALPPAFRSMRVELAAMNRPFTQPGASDPETVKKLASLGYISATSSAAGGSALPDPKDRIGALARLKEASRLSAEGRFEQAASILRELVRESSAMLDPWEGLARVLKEAGRPAEAFDALLEADRLSPGTPQILLGLADLALRKGDIPRARTYAQAAAVLGASGATQALAEIALASGDLPEARRLAKTCLQEDARSRSCWLLLATVEKQAGDSKSAWEILERLRNLRDAGRGPLENENFLRGDVLARMGRESEAETAFRAEVSAFPDNPAGWTGLALLYASQGRPDDARRVLDELISKSPRPRSYFAAARTWEVLEDRQAAVAMRRRAESLFPGSRDPSLRTR
jgi:arylsulfatase A-like enzyme/tetratricopeptide (TPR) repeat protein